MLHNPFNGTVKDEAIALWLEQFEDSEKVYIRKLLLGFEFYGFGRVNSSIRQLHAQILMDLQISADSIWFIPVGYVAKSGSVIAYLYKTQNDIPQERFVLATDLATIHLEPGTAVVFLDDYIGSGHQARQVWDIILSVNSSAPELVTFVFGAIVGTRAGIEHVKTTTKFRVITVDQLSEVDLPLSDASRVFPDAHEREIAKVVLEKYGARLYPKAPLGYASSQGLLGFFYSTPNNTLPIFWSTEDGWKPLLPHKETYRDPAFLLGPPSGLLRSPNASRPLIESAQLDQYDISHEISIKIFTEFQRSDIFLALAPIIRSLSLSDTTFTNLMRLIAELKHLQHEREYVCTSLLIVPEEIPEDSLESFFLQASPNLRLDNVREAVALAQLVNGFEGALVATAAGRILGDVLFRGTASTSYPLLPDRFHKAARASLDSRGLLFLFLGGGRAAVFHSGNRLLVYRAASWHLQPTQIEQGIRTLADGYSLDYAALQMVFRLAFRLSDEGHGALLTVGDHESVLGISDKPKSGHITWSPMHVGQTQQEALMGLMRQDGATIIAADGTVVQGMTFIRPPAGARGVEEVGRGSKHSTAAKVSGATRCISIAVSVDGLITVFGNGDSLFKLMG